jgi:hypothetical protein
MKITLIIGFFWIMRYFALKEALKIINKEEYRVGIFSLVGNSLNIAPLYTKEKAIALGKKGGIVADIAFWVVSLFILILSIIDPELFL